MARAEPTGSARETLNPSGEIGATSAEAPSALSRWAKAAGLPSVCLAWLMLCALSATSLVAARTVHYWDLGRPELMERVVDGLMQVGLHTSFWFWQLLTLSGKVLPFVVLALLMRTRWFVRQERGRWGTRPWLYTLLCSGIALAHIGFDINPWVALGSAGATTLLVLGTRLLSGWFAWLPAGVFLLVWIALSDTFADAVAVLFWGALLALLEFLRQRWLLLRDVLALGVCLSVLAQVGSAFVPLFWPRHGGTRLGAGMVYGFCEDETRGRVYAAVAGKADLRYRDGHVVEYDSQQLTKLRELRFTSELFSGRLMQLLCLPNSIQVAMAKTWRYGQPQPENVMEFEIDRPEKVNHSLWGIGMGQQLLWDKKRDAVYYTSEWSNAIYRLDRRTGVVDRGYNAGLIPPRPTWVGLATVNGSFPMAPTTHAGRDSFFIGHWLTGSTVYELDLGRPAVRRRFEPRTGHVADLAVDEQYDRVYVTTLWGFDVIDLRDGRVARRIRTGTGARTPVIDSKNGLVYVSTTVEGKMRAYDRATLEPVGVLAVGTGVRRGHFLSGAGRILATNTRGYYYWDATALARRLKAE